MINTPLRRCLPICSLPVMPSTAADARLFLPLQGVRPRADAVGASSSKAKLLALARPPRGLVLSSRWPRTTSTRARWRRRRRLRRRERDLNTLKMDAEARGVLAQIAPGTVAVHLGLGKPEVSDALEQKDGSRVERLLAAQGLRGPVAASRSPGSPISRAAAPARSRARAVLDQAAPIFAGTPAEAPLREPTPRCGRRPRPFDGARSARAPAISARILRLDLGEVRGFAYYTGAIFHVLAAGPGEPIGAGGRYDDLLGRFDAPMPAVGFALYLDAVAWARPSRRASAIARRGRGRRVRLGREAAPIVAALRARGIAAVAHGAEGAAAYAAAWQFSHLVTASGDPRRYRAESVAGVGPAAIDEGDPEALARAIAEP